MCVNMTVFCVCVYDTVSTIYILVFTSACMGKSHTKFTIAWIPIEIIGFGRRKFTEQR